MSEKNNEKDKGLSEPHIDNDEVNSTSIPGETKTKDDTWKSCCGYSWSIAAVKYFATYSISFSVLVFSMVMIASGDDDDNKFAIWVSIISGIASQYMPSPIMNN